MCVLFVCVCVRIPFVCVCYMKNRSTLRVCVLRLWDSDCALLSVYIPTSSNLKQHTGGSASTTATQLLWMTQRSVRLLLTCCSIAALLIR